jgi:hypothetical protein
MIAETFLAIHTGIQVVGNLGFAKFMCLGKTYYLRAKVFILNMKKT